MATNTVPPFSNQIIADSSIYYYLFNKKMLLDSLSWVLDYSSRSTNGTLAMKPQDKDFPKGQSPFQHWTLISTGTGYYYLYNEVSKLVMQYAEGKLSLTKMNGGNPDRLDRNQHWSMKEASANPGYYYIIQPATGKALDWNGELTLKTKDVGFSPEENPFQHWLFELAFSRTNSDFSIGSLLPAAPFDLQTASGAYVSGVLDRVSLFVTTANTPGMNLRFDPKTGHISMQHQGANYYLTFFGRKDDLTLRLIAAENQAASFEILADDSGYSQLLVTTQSRLTGYLMARPDGKLGLSWDQFSTNSFFAVISYNENLPQVVFAESVTTEAISLDSTFVLLVWQLTGAFLLTFVTPLPISQSVRADVVRALLTAVPDFQRRVEATARNIYNDPDNTAQYVKELLAYLWEEGVFATMLHQIFISLSYVAIGTMLSRVIIFLLAPGLEVAELLAGFALWQYQTIQATLDYINAHH